MLFVVISLLLLLTLSLQTILGAHQQRQQTSDTTAIASQRRPNEFRATKMVSRLSRDYLQTISDYLQTVDPPSRQPASHRASQPAASQPPASLRAASQPASHCASQPPATSQPPASLRAASQPASQQG